MGRAETCDICTCLNKTDSPFVEIKQGDILCPDCFGYFRKMYRRFHKKQMAQRELYEGQVLDRMKKKGGPLVCDE